MHVVFIFNQYTLQEDDLISVHVLMQSGLDVQFSEAECYKIDPKNNKVYCRASHDKKLGGTEEFSLDYDYLVIAMGARSNTFNTPGVEEHAYFLKVILMSLSRPLKLLYCGRNWSCRLEIRTMVIIC